MKHLLFFFVLLFGGWLFATSEAVAAEERLIAVIMANSQPRYQDIHATFVENSQSFCGQNCKIYVQTPNADTMSLRNSVRKAVALGAELIVTYGPAATLAAKAENPSTTTLFADVYDPVLLELVDEESLVGRNMTGIRGDAPVQSLLKYFVDATDADQLAVLYDVKSPAANLQKTTLEKNGKKRGVTVIPLAVQDTGDHSSPLQEIPEGTDGVFLASSEHTDTHLQTVLDFAAKRQMPVITQRAGAADMGAFMVLETSAVEQGEKLAEMAEQVLSGKDVDELPMYKPHQVSFVVNLKIAKEYGIQVPFQTLSITSRVVR